MYNAGYDSAAAAVGATTVIVCTLISLAVTILILVALWKVFDKAGEPGWASLVPFYNYYVLFKIAMGNGWLFLLMFVPCVNIVMIFIVFYKLAIAFGKDAGFGVGMIFLSPIFLCILAFGDAEYQGV